MVISAAANLGWILPTTNPALGKHTACWTVGEIENGFQDFLITIEMLFAAAAHHFVFPYTDLGRRVEASFFPYSFGGFDNT